MKKIRDFNVVYLATGQRNASRDSGVPGMKKVEAFRPKCRCRHSTHWLTPGGPRISAFLLRGRGRLWTGVVAHESG